ncbi:hypothetical protein JL722_827 [Aureococcus anophagefferens]|nr:hypothetical protein JL722_827 [Aureococcus anophagefferens]
MPPARKSKDKEYASARRRRSEQEAAARAPAEDRDAAREAAAARRSAALALAAERCGETVPGRETAPSRALVAPQNAVARQAKPAVGRGRAGPDAALFALDAKGRRRSTASRRARPRRPTSRGFWRWTRGSSTSEMPTATRPSTPAWNSNLQPDFNVHAAAATDAVPCLRLLLDAGADATARNAQGFAPLALAASRSASRAAVVLALELEARGLVAAGALDAPGGGYAPLHWACVNDLPDAAATLAAALALARALVGRGADVRAADGDGRTALGYATRGAPALRPRPRHGRRAARAAAATPAAPSRTTGGDRAAPAGGTVVDRFFYKLSFPMARPDAAPPPAPPRPPRADLD